MAAALETAVDVVPLPMSMPELPTEQSFEADVASEATALDPSDFSETPGRRKSRARTQSLSGNPASQPRAKRGRHAHSSQLETASRSVSAIDSSVDEGLTRRTITNRQSALRSKQRQRAYVIGLEQQVKTLSTELAQYRDELYAKATASCAIGGVPSSAFAPLSRSRHV